MTTESKQAQTLLRVFEALGVPLIGAVDELLAWQAPAGGYASEDAAKNFAALLSASIGTGSQLANRLAPATQEEAEAVRLKASTLAGAVIAQHYVLSGQLPDEAFNRRLSTAFDGLLSLADSFALLPDEQVLDTDLTAARVEAMTPFIQAVMRFPFGQDDTAVIRQLGERLCDKATALADAFSAGHENTPALFATRELAFLKGCSKLLARACEIEMDRMQQALSQGQITQPPAPDVLVAHIFRRFESGLDVLRAVIGFITGPVGEKAKSGDVIARPQAPKMPAPPSQKQAGNTAGAAASSNPMSFFVKKEDADTPSGSGEAA